MMTAPFPVWGKPLSAFTTDGLKGKGPPIPSRFSGMSWKQLLARANQMYEIANLDRALEYATQLIKSEPNIPGGWRISGLVKSDMREYEAARKNMEKCIRLTEKYFGKDVKSLQYDYESLGHVFKHINQLEEAIAAYKKAVAIDSAKDYYIDQLVLACQWKYAQKYGNFDLNILLESDFRKSYNISELAEEFLIIREFRHSDGGRWAIEEQKISITGEQRIDYVTLFCERCDAIAVVQFHINYGPDNTKRLGEITNRYRTALKDEDADIRIFAASQLNLLEEKWLTALARDPAPWVRLSALRWIKKNRPVLKIIQEYLVDSDPMVNRMAVATAKSAIGHEFSDTDQE